MLIKNKQGDVSIVVLVFLVLLVFSTSLFIFITKKVEFEEKISGNIIFNKVYVQENLIEFYLNDVGKIALVKTYKDFVDDSSDKYDYINIRETVSGNPKFKELHINLNNNFEERFSENFKKEFEGYAFEEDYLKDLKQKITEDGFEVSFDGTNLEIIVKNIKLENSIEDVSVEYTSNIVINLNLNKVSLDDFEDVYYVKNICDNQQECYNQGLVNFEVIVNQDSSFVTLTSKKEFLIDGEFKKIEFAFIPS